jgi:plastocyanin
MSKLRIAIMVAIGLSLALAPGVTQAGRAKVKATDDRTWSPDFKHVIPGTKVIWKNVSNLNHTMTAYGGNWSKNVPLAPDAKTSKKFRKEGVFRYRCSIHSTLAGDDCTGMCAVIHVAP